LSGNPDEQDRQDGYTEGMVIEGAGEIQMKRIMYGMAQSAAPAMFNPKPFEKAKGRSGPVAQEIEHDKAQGPDYDLRSGQLDQFLHGHPHTFHAKVAAVNRSVTFSEE